ncbi:MAG: DUF2306 domain-containing protein [Planctomycetota bacterium]
MDTIYKANPRAGKAASLPWWQVALLTSLLVLAARILFGILWEYRWYFPANFDQSFFLAGHMGDFVGLWKLAFYVHILSSPPVIVFAILLMFSGPQPSKHTFHSRLSKIQVLLVLGLVLPSGFVLALSAMAGPIAQSGFVALSLLTAYTAIAATYWARRRSIKIHRRWATRFFVLLMSPLVLRFCSGLAIAAHADSDLFYQVNAWTSWLAPLAALEIWLRIKQPF